MCFTPKLPTGDWIIDNYIFQFYSKNINTWNVSWKRRPVNSQLDCFTIAEHIRYTSVKKHCARECSSLYHNVLIHYVTNEYFLYQWSKSLFSIQLDLGENEHINSFCLANPFKVILNESEITLSIFIYL